MSIQNTKVKVVGTGGNNPITFNIAIGGGQTGNTTIYHNGKNIHSQDDNFSKALDGLKAGDQVEVVSTISDLPTNPNRITVTHSVTPQNISADYDDKVSEGDVAYNTTRFIFY
jgi:hypothetical protein